MKNAMMITLAFIAGIFSFLTFDAYEPTIDPVVNTVSDVAIEGQFGAEYDIKDDKRSYEVKTAHDFIISVMAERELARQKVYFYDRFGIRGFVSHYYRRNAQRRTKFYDREDVLRNKANVYKALDEAYKQVENTNY